MGTRLRARHRSAAWSTLCAGLRRLHPRHSALARSAWSGLCSRLAAHRLSTECGRLRPTRLSTSRLRAHRGGLRAALGTWSTRHSTHRATHRGGTRSTLRSGLRRLHPRHRTLAWSARCSLCSGLATHRLTAQSSGRDRITRRTLGPRLRLARRRLILLHPRLLRPRRLLTPGRLVASHHRNGTLRHRRRSGRALRSTADRCGDRLRRGGTRSTQRRGLYARALRRVRGAERSGLHTSRTTARCRAFGLRGDLRLRGNFTADLSDRGGLRLLGVVLAHDRSEIQILDLRRLVPGMAAGGAFQRAAFLPEQLCRDFKVRCAIRAGDTHSFTHWRLGVS